MSETIKKGWLEDKDGNKFAPKTTIDQVLNPDGSKYKNTVDDRIDGLENDVKNDIAYYEEKGFLSRNLFNGDFVDVILNEYKDYSNYKFSSDMILNYIVGKTYVVFGGYFKAGTYTFSYSNKAWFSLNRIAIAGDKCKSTALPVRNSYTWTQEVDGYTYFGIEGDDSEGGTKDTPFSITPNIQIEEGSVVHSYTECAKSNVDLSRENIDLKMLGYTIPKECPIQNEVNGNQFIQKVGRVDLGTLDWQYSTSSGRFYKQIDGIKKPNYDSEYVNIYCSQYTSTTANITITLDKSIGVDHLGEIFIKDSSISSSQKPTGYLYYELAEEIPIPIDGNEVVTSLDSIVKNIKQEIKILLQKIYGFHVDSNQSNPSNAVTYLKDAKGMTPAYMDYTKGNFNYGSWGDAFFMPRPCMLKFNGQVDYYLDPNDFTKKVDGTASDVANPDYEGNAMMEWGQNGDKIWYTIENDADDNGYTVYISNNQVDRTYHAWSFIDHNNQYKDHFYTPIYNGSLINGKLRSLSGQAYMINATASEELAYASANNVGDDKGWCTETFADRTLINLLLVLMGKSLDTQSVFGQGHTTGGSEAVFRSKTTGMLDNKGLFYGSNGTTTDVKVFGIENFWGNQWRRIAGLMNSNSHAYYKLTYGTADGSGKIGYDTSIENMIDGGELPETGWIKKQTARNKNVLLPSMVGGASNTYYCDYYWLSTSTTYALVGGHCGTASGCGGFYLYLDLGAGRRDWLVAAALSYR